MTITNFYQGSNALFYRQTIQKSDKRIVVRKILCTVLALVSWS